MDKERRDELFDLVQNLDFDYDILQIDWWEYSDQWTVLINNFRKFNIYQIVRDIHNDAVCRVEMSQYLNLLVDILILFS